MAEAEPEADGDWRDVLVGFAAFFDCAERLGVDPVELFELAGRGRSPAMQSLAATFAKRTDVKLETFGWTLVDHDGSPCYRPLALG